MSESASATWVKVFQRAAIEQGNTLSDCDPLALARGLEQVLERARAAWPSLACAPERFCRALGERVPAQGSPFDWLATVQAGDLYLACACVDGDAAAMALLEAHFLSPLESELRGAGSLARHADEARQMLRMRLLVGRDGQPPRLTGYRGSGPLSAWLRLTLTRLAIDLAASEKRHSGIDQPIALAGSPVGEDPELAFLRRRYGESLQVALRDAIECTPEEQRTILRLHFLDGVSADQIGALYGCSGRTIQRRIADARRDILERMRVLLGQRMGAKASEIDSILRLAGSQMAVSLRRVLGSQSHTPPGGAR